MHRSGRVHPPDREIEGRQARRGDPGLGGRLSAPAATLVQRGLSRGEWVDPGMETPA